MCHLEKVSSEEKKNTAAYFEVKAVQELKFKAPNNYLYNIKC